MNYSELSEMLPLGREGEMILGLETTQQLMEVLGNPQDKLQTIHVAGTNGKGSTTAILDSILREAGYKVGMYTSPSLVEFNDRIRINNKPISDEEIRRHARAIREYVLGTDIYFTEFELYTALAWMHFYEQECDIIIIETGIGGTLDATNIIKEPVLSVITKLALDHIDILGDTLEKIASQKAGIIKPNRPVVYYPTSKESDIVIESRAEELDAPIRHIDIDALEVEYTRERHQDFTYRGRAYRINLLEAHQVMNSCLAIEAIEALNDDGQFNISEDALKNGLEKARWAGRFEWVHDNPVMIVDGSHNLDGVTGLATNLAHYFPTQKHIAIIGMLGDKDVRGAIQTIMPIFEKAVVVEPDYPERAMKSKDMAKNIVEYGGLSEDDIFIYGTDFEGALEKAVALTKEMEEEAMICIFGSFYYIGDMREIILKNY